jgi:uncharacterized OB-fold protein
MTLEEVRPAGNPPAEQAIRDGAARVAAGGESAPWPARDPVNLPMIRNWTEALGDGNPLYAEGFAPPAMIQVWTMPGLHGRRSDDDPLAAMMRVMDEAGFTSVVATNCSQTYHRYLRVGEELTVSSRLEDVVGPKRTALGEGWFVTTRNTWYADGEPVAEMTFRVLKFRPPPKPSADSPSLDGREVPPAEIGDRANSRADDVGSVMRPVISRDTEFFWAGTARRELRIQRCEDCGALRHPPGPLCRACGSGRQGYAVAAGTGTVYSYVVHHRPQVPGRRTPYVVALVELTEGVRMLGELVGADPATVAIGDAVEVSWHEVDDDLTLPAWRRPGDRS